MKKAAVVLLSVFAMYSCTSNTIYKKPENLIPKDTMVALLTDMYIASAAKNQKNKFLKREKNYMMFVYNKYHIDSTRFSTSNTYYTSTISEYFELLKDVKKNIDSLYDTYEELYTVQDSIKRSKKSKKDSLKSFDDSKLPLELKRKKIKTLKPIENITPS